VFWPRPEGLRAASGASGTRPKGLRSGDGGSGRRSEGFGSGGGGSGGRPKGLGAMNGRSGRSLERVAGEPERSSATAHAASFAAAPSGCWIRGLAIAHRDDVGSKPRLQELVIPWRRARAFMVPRQACGPVVQGLLFCSMACSWRAPPSRSTSACQETPERAARAETKAGSRPVDPTGGGHHASSWDLDAHRARSSAVRSTAVSTRRRGARHPASGVRARAARRASLRLMVATALAVPAAAVATASASPATTIRPAARSSRRVAVAQAASVASRNGVHPGRRASRWWSSLRRFRF